MARPRLVLLGTGMPFPDPRRRGPAQVVDAGGALMLVDCGASALHRLVEAGLDGRRIRQIAITHLHSDHVTGIADLLWAGAIYRWWESPPPVVGPPGTSDLFTRLIDAFSYDLRVRSFDRLETCPPVSMASRSKPGGPPGVSPLPGGPPGMPGHRNGAPSPLQSTG